MKKTVKRQLEILLKCYVCYIRITMNDSVSLESSSLTLISGFLPRNAQLVTAGIQGLGGTHTSKAKLETRIRIGENKGGLYSWKC